MIPLTTGCVSSAKKSLSFKYEDGSGPGELGVRKHEVSIPEVKGQVYAYATFEMGPVNPIPYVDDQPRGRQLVTLGQTKDGEFVPAVRFGIHDGRGLPADKGYMTTYLFDGQLDYYGMWVRPNTPYDFKLQLDLGRKKMTVWVSGRGDDDWYLLAEDAPPINAVTEINGITVEQYPGAASIHDLMVCSEPWEPAEKVRSHPLAKQDRVVFPGRGFSFQPMRSTWGLLGRHVAVARKPRFHHGFPDVAKAGPNHFVAAWRNGSHTGGAGGISVAHSYDLARTWSEPTLVYPGGSNCLRLQRLKDGTLLLMVDVGRKTVLYDSLDSGHTWINERWLNPQQVGGQAAIVPSRVTELPDDSWLLGSAWYPGPGEPQGNPYKGTEGCRLEFFRSTDRGQTWEFLSYLQPYPPPEGAKRSFHSISEPSILVLPDGRLLLYARENRHDGFPGIKAYSKDNCKTWEVKELPFAVTGRTCAGFLPDGRVMLTFRSGIGRCALWAWVGDPHDTMPFCAAGSHFNDHYTVGLKDGTMHIDNDGMRGQFTQYFLRQPDSTDTVIDVTVEVKVVQNSGRAATLSVPFVGKFRLFFDHD